jgi:hypothetical protein
VEVKKEIKVIKTEDQAGNTSIDTIVNTTDTIKR